MKKLFMFCAIGSLLLTGCKKDGVESSNTTDTTNTTNTVEDEIVVQTTVQEDQDNISRSLSEIVTCMGSMKDGDLMSSFVDFAGLSNGEVMDEEFIETLIEELEDAYNNEEELNEFDEDRFPFELLTGTWSYDVSNKTWSHTKNPNNKVIVEFPSDKSQTINNVVASLSDYEDVQYTFDMEDVWLPKSFELSVKKNGVELAKMDLNNLSLEQSNDILIPTDLEGSIFLAPFTLSMSGERTTSKEFTAEMSLEDGSGCGYAVGATLKLDHDDYENLDEENFISINGFVEHNTMKMEYFIALQKLAELDDLEGDMDMDDINANIDVKLFMDDQNIGELSLTESSEDEDEVNVIVTYKDGTSEDSKRFYEPFVDDLELEFAAILGDWDELFEEDDEEDYYDDLYDDYNYDEENGNDYENNDNDDYDYGDDYGNNDYDDYDYGDDYGYGNNDDYVDGEYTGEDGSGLTDEEKAYLEGLYGDTPLDSLYMIGNQEYLGQ